MPTENEKPSAVPAAAVVPDPRDAEITSLKQQVSDLEKKLKQRNTVPPGNYCVLGGKTYEVAGTIQTRFASEEGRKTNTEDEELVILKR